MAQVKPHPAHQPQHPPNAIEAEQSVLGGLMLNNKLYDELSDKLNESDFYRADHQLIYRAIGELIVNNRPCDFVTLSEHLRNQGKLEDAGGVAYLGSLAVDTYSVTNVLSYAQIVRERSVLRNLIQAGNDIGQMGYQPAGRNPSELIDAAEQKVFAIREMGSRGNTSYRPLGELVRSVENRITLLRSDPNALRGLATGFTEMDRMTSGLHPGDLVIVAGRPGMGKTSFAMNIAEHAAFVDKKGVAVFSMEMSGEQLAQRILASYSRVDLKSLRTGQLSDHDFAKLGSTGGLISSAPLYIDETGALSPLELRARARRLKSRFDIQLIVIDYIQLMGIPGGRENRANEVSEISRSLKALAKEVGVPVIALSQLSRRVEQRGDDKRPNMSDLRESGSIEQDADVVIFIYREEYYKPDDPALRNKAEIIISKQRNGPTGKFDVAFIKECTRFDNLADARYEAA